MSKKGFIQLENGEKLEGIQFGYWTNDDVVGEVVFQTGMVGYIESLTDPSYRDQILVVSYPLIGNYGVPNEQKDEFGINLEFESDKIHVKGFIVGNYDEIYSHWNAKTSLHNWFVENKIPGLTGVDTRKLVKILRENGSVIGKLCQNITSEKLSLISSNLVDQVSQKTTKIINKGGSPKVMVIDCGIKNNQLRILASKGAELTIVSWNYDFLNDEFDRLFISNGPGDPRDCYELIDRLKRFIEKDNGQTPIMGICLGHQLFSLAIGAECYKMKYGNRGLNIPCLLSGSKKAFITAQNHGYAVDITKLNSDYHEMFVNLNDGTNEGIYHDKYPYFSVQFHPEAKSGPEDTSFLFDIFLKGEHVKEYIQKNMKEIQIKKRKKVLILGSGGLKIGQSGEFDYSGSQAIKAYKEEGMHVVLINPNIATVQTSTDLVDKVYFLPINLEYVTKIIKLERPDCISLSFGGQTALNCGIDLYKTGVLNKYNVEVLGTTVETVITAEDRLLFKKHVESENVGEKVIPSCVVDNIEDGLQFGRNTQYPILVRAAFALGGLGSGFANNETELLDLLKIAFANSNQVILDQSLKGWKELEFEVVRDVYDNCITTCSMENIDPLGVHTGESIVVAPSQTLTDKEHNMLRSCALKVVRSLNIVGECNIQFALDPSSLTYYIIELNPRLSRSSALASKATGYPLAYIGAKLSLGYSLTDIKNNITKSTTACFEPSMDYCVVKVPRWDLKKFPLVDRRIGTAMKSVGEAMAIGRDFNEAFQKALRMANESVDGFDPDIVPYKSEYMSEPRDDRMLSIASGLYNGESVDTVHELTKIDKWFLLKFEKIIKLVEQLNNAKELSTELVILAKKNGFSDKMIAKHTKSTELVVRQIRKKYNINPVIKQIDTVAGEFPCFTNYLYLTYNADESDVNSNENNIVVLGSGVYKIGSSVEFDWCAVSSIRELKKMGEKVVMINCNPETVSTDYDEADKLYFEELSFETVMDIYEIENPKGIILSMGGQLPNNIAMPLFRQGVKVIGTTPDKVDQAENRYKFSRLLDNIKVDQPVWKELTSIEDAINFCHEVEYPCLVRPSYVLSGVAMNVAYSDKDLIKYLNSAVAVSRDHPVVISKFIIDAKEIEVDAVSENGIVKHIAISEHVENAGVHSGDATLILPPQDLTDETLNRIKKSVSKISRALNINGPFNIQFIAKDNQIKVIECNLRVSRSFPFVSKTLGVNFIREAVRIMMGLGTEHYKFENRIGVKVSQFSFSRLKDADINLGVEMLSTGEVACFGKNHYEAFIKAVQSTGVVLPKKSILITIGSYKFKQEFRQAVKTLIGLGYDLYGTQGTADYYNENGIKIKELGLNDVNDFLEKKIIELCIVISKKNKIRSQSDVKTNGYLIRRKAIDNGIHVVTDIKFAKLLVNSLDFLNKTGEIVVQTEIDSLTSYKRVRLPGLIDVHVHVREPGATHKEDWTTCSKAAISGGITTIFAMPNTDPSIVDNDSFDLVCNIAKTKSLCDYGIIVGASKTNFNITNLSKKAVGLKMYLNNTFGTLKLDSMSDWVEHVRNWDDSVSPICVHAEGKTLGAILNLGQLFNKRVHVCHVATKEEIDIIKICKEMGMKVTCEVAPHHLFLTNDDRKKLGNCGHVKPELAFDKDQQALWDNMKIIDCFATDHAPHTINEKQDCGCPGFPGLETALPLLLTAVKQGRLTVDDIILRYHTNPKKIFNITTDDNTWIEVDLDKEWTILDKTKYSKAGWTPFAGKRVYGKVRRVVIRNKTVFIDDKFVVEAGFGINVRERNENVIKSDSNSHLDASFIEIPIDTNVKLNHVVTVEQFDRRMLRTLFKRAETMRTTVKEKGTINILNNKVIGCLFYEPSTRTRCSFSVATKRLGGQVLEVGASEASVQKGETIEDTVRSLECYCDGLIIRSSVKGYIDKAVSVAKKPIINAGDGTGEHPTQALLDIFTIREERGTVNGLTIAVVGDLKNGRTVHSLVKLLTNYTVRIVYISPKGLEIPDDVWNYVNNKGVEQMVYKSLDEILEKIDILYMTRIQKERFTDMNEYEKVKGSYIITPRTLTKAKDDLVIMHPLPRVDEISTELDNDPRSAYFRQMEYGLYVRMALLEMVFV